jgi:hypothetical protein
MAKTVYQTSRRVKRNRDGSSGGGGGGFGSININNPTPDLSGFYTETEADGRFVHLVGDEVIDGSKTFIKGGAAISINSSVINFGIDDSSLVYDSFMQFGVFSGVNNIYTRSRDFLFFSDTKASILRLEHDTGEVIVGEKLSFASGATRTFGWANSISGLGNNLEIVGQLSTTNIGGQVNLSGGEGESGGDVNISAGDGNAGGFAWGGDLKLRAGNSENVGGNVFIIAGFATDSAGTLGNIYLGTGSFGSLQPQTSETHLVYYAPATGLISYKTYEDPKNGLFFNSGSDRLIEWEASGGTTGQAITITGQTASTLGGAMVVQAGEATAGTGGLLWLLGGVGANVGGAVFLIGGGSDLDGGDVYISGGGSNESSGADGDIYFSDGSVGTLKGRTNETNVVYYNTTTGLLSYGSSTGSGALSAVGTPVDNQIAVWTGASTLEGSTKFIYITNTYLYVDGNLALGGGDRSVYPSDANGSNLTLKGGDNAGDTSADFGGNVYIYGGVNDTDDPDQDGDVYFGTGAAGKLHLKSSETNIVYYNPTTGLLSYGLGGGVGISGTPADNQIAVWTNANTIEGTSALTFNLTTLGVHGDILFNNDDHSISIDGNSGSSLTIYAGGAAAIDEMGGALYIHGGISGASYTYDYGPIYLGGILGGSLWPKTTETNVVYYNPSTGLLSYAAPAAGLVSNGTKHSENSAGTAGELSYDDDYLYVCVSTGGSGSAIWKRIPLMYIY